MILLLASRTEVSWFCVSASSAPKVVHLHEDEAWWIAESMFDCGVLPGEAK